MGPSPYLLTCLLLLPLHWLLWLTGPAAAPCVRDCLFSPCASSLQTARAAVKATVAAKAFVFADGASHLGNAHSQVLYALDGGQQLPTAAAAASAAQNSIRECCSTTGRHSGTLYGSRSHSKGRRHLVLIDWSDRLVPYELAWASQHALLMHQLLQLESRQNQEQEKHEVEMLPGVAPRQVVGNTKCDFAILTQHPSVYTLGQGASLSFVAPGLREKERQLELPEQLQLQLQTAEGVFEALQQISDAVFDASAKLPQDTPELLRVERGGEVTWHGPGQLVLYPIFDLRKHHTDVRAFIEALESAAAEALVSLWIDFQTPELSLHELHQKQRQLQQRQLQQQQQNHQEGELLSAPWLQLRRYRSMPGVWAANKKVCSVGVRIRRWISYHGLSLNVTNSIDPYSRIVACGLRGKDVTTAYRWLQLLQHQHEQEQQGQHQGQPTLLQQEEHEDSSAKRCLSSPLLAKARKFLTGAICSSFGFSSLAVTKNIKAAIHLASTDYS